MRRENAGGSSIGNCVVMIMLFAYYESEVLSAGGNRAAIIYAMHIFILYISYNVS